MSGSMLVYRCEDYRIEAHGVDDADAPLTVIATCQHCGRQLSTRSYRKEEWNHVPLELYLRRVSKDSMVDARGAINHKCVSN